MKNSWGVLMTAGIAAVIILASFYPFKPILDRPEALSRQWHRFLNPTIDFHRKPLTKRVGHMLLNVLFYLPLGLAAGRTLRRPERRSKWTRLQWCGLFLGLALSLPIELGQIGFSSRDPDLLDVVMNAIGYGMGYCVGMKAVGIGLWPEKMELHERRSQG